MSTLSALVLFLFYFLDLFMFRTLLVFPPFFVFVCFFVFFSFGELFFFNLFKILCGIRVSRKGAFTSPKDIFAELFDVRLDLVEAFLLITGSDTYCSDAFSYVNGLVSDISSFCNKSDTSAVSNYFFLNQYYSNWYY